MRTLLCAIARCENLYLKDWVRYYKNIGFDNIVICDNNFDGEDNIYDSIGNYIDNGFVMLRNYRNIPRCQVSAYENCFNEFHNSYDWIAFFDIDEFLTLVRHNNIKEYLCSSNFNEFSAILINWLTYGDGGKTKYENYPIYDRITTPLDFGTVGINGFILNNHVKSIIRGNAICSNNIEGLMSTPHAPLYVDGKVCNSDGKEIELSCFNDKYTYENAYLRHYTTKTAEEYAKGKLKHGMGDMDRDILSVYGQFFALNKMTNEKYDIMQEGLKNSYASEKIEVIYIATGGYVNFLEGFLWSMKYFAPGMKKIVRILTDSDNVQYNIDNPDIERIEVIKMFDLFYPCINLHKTLFIKQLKPTDAKYIFYFDADTFFIERKEYNWGALFGLMDNNYMCLGCHPYYNLSDNDKKKYDDIKVFFSYMTERDCTQTSFIPYEEYTYVISSFFCANRDTMYRICDKVNIMIRQDLKRVNHYRIPLFMDENYFNKLVSDCEHGNSNEFNFKVGNYILLGNSINIDNLPESFIYQKNFNKEFKINRQ